jgi:hypothetical protein
LARVMQNHQEQTTSEPLPSGKTALGRAHR